MNRTEQKERLNDIIVLANDTIKALVDKKDWLLEVFMKIDELDNIIHEHGEVSEWDESTVKDSVSNTLFEGELEQLYDEVISFKEDIDSYAYELSEKKQEQLEERYNMLDEVVDKLDQSSAQYSEVYDVIENIQEVIHELTQMKK